MCEVAFSAWISPFATLVGLEDQASAALLTTAYYVPYTVLLETHPVSFRVKHDNLLRQARDI